MKTTRVLDIVAKPHFVFIWFLIVYEDLHIKTKKLPFLFSIHNFLDKFAEPVV